MNVYSRKVTSAGTYVLRRGDGAALGYVPSTDTAFFTHHTRLALRLTADDAQDIARMAEQQEPPLILHARQEPLDY